MLASKLLTVGSASAMPNPSVVQELGSVSSVSGGNFRLSNVEFGTPSASRVVVVAFLALNGNLPTSVTVGGAAAIEAVRSTETTLVVASIWYCPLPNGDRGDISVVKPNDDCAVSWFRFDASNPTPISTATGTATGSVSASIETGDAGFLVWAMCDRGVSTAHTSLINSEPRPPSVELTVNSTRAGAVGALSGTSGGTTSVSVSSSLSDTVRAVFASWSA